MNSPLSLKISSFRYKKKIRYINQNRSNLLPSITLSIYECYLIHTKDSPGSVYNELKNLSYFFTWANNNQYPIEKILCTGSPPEAIRMRSFGHWLHEQPSKKNRSRKLINKTCNIIITAVKRMFCWFIEQYNSPTGDATERTHKKELLYNAIERLFKKLKKKTPKKNEAPDLTELEIWTIEQYLKPKNRLKQLSKKSPELIAMVYRDYLIWRLVIEFGLRIGEILALRIEDCPHRGQIQVNIVRIEERGNKYTDPRNPAPRPKSLSRELGFILKNSPIPDLVNDYISKHRYRGFIRHGKKVRQPVLDKNQFLIIAHKNDSGKPLSIRGVEEIANRIAKNTGIDFHWHLGRHAFFNRAYSAIIDDPEFKDRKKDLIYWGGWERDESLDIYIRRARKKRARKALIFWQEGENQWEALM